MDDELSYCSLIDITDDNLWDPYRATKIYTVNSEVSNNSGHLMGKHIQHDLIGGCFFQSANPHISLITVTKPKYQLTP